MKSLMIATVLAALSAVPAMAQSNSGSQNPAGNPGTYPTGPQSGNSQAFPDCTANDSRPECQQQAQTPNQGTRNTGDYDKRQYGPGRPGANGLNDQPKNGHEGGG